MLRVTSAVTYYDRVRALKGVSLHVGHGEVVAMIGANGAGKSTVLRTITGATPAASGTVVFEDRDITRATPEHIVALGVSHVPEGRQLLYPMSVADHLQLGAYRWPRRDKREAMGGLLERIYELFPVLRERHAQAAGTLSGGEQQMLTIARALMARPKLILFDEPSVGLAPMVAREIFTTISRLREQRITVLLVEQNARAALDICDRGYVLETGRVVLEGTAQELKEDREVQRAYLGRGYRRVEENRT
ncbi:MAG: ABC transporter ATP-binding protein [Armatimonadota bacterium]|nr:MAG: ABC transporter ATP-binding protein [Armatimonadota bacterium]